MRYALYIIPGILFLAIGATFFRALSLNPSYINSPLIGNPAPQFELQTVRNPDATVGTKDLLGQVSLVNIWATWCPECRHEHGFLVELSKANIVPIYGVNWNDSREEAMGWLNSLGDPYVASAFDTDGSVAIDWGVYGAPETFLVDRDGTVLHKRIGAMTPAVWQAEFMPIIRELCSTLPCERRGPQTSQVPAAESGNNEI